MSESTAYNRRALLVTADDFGLREEINLGIIKAHQHGILRSTALLMNGMATASAIDLAKRHPQLEIGIHLGIVEGYSLRAKPSSITDQLRYFGDAVCLHRGWPAFIKRYLQGRIDLEELEDELDLQLSRMRDALGKIAFANGTQHLHLLPGVLGIVLKLMKKYEISWLRLPDRSLMAPGSTRRQAANMAMRLLGRRARQLAGKYSIGGARYFTGFDVCGHLTPDLICRMIEEMPEGTMELMTHPGYDCPYLREHLPWGYRDFDWSGELKALLSPDVANMITRNKVDLIQFKDLKL